MTFMYVTVALALVTATMMLLLSRRDSKTFKKNLWWPLALIALAAIQGYAAYRENLAAVEIERVRVEIEAIKKDAATGRKLTSDEAQKRSDRLMELSERLDAVRRR